ncbi:unnamed protein product [Phaeothamnion confervicola]
MQSARALRRIRASPRWRTLPHQPSFPVLVHRVPAASCSSKGKSEAARKDDQRPDSLWDSLHSVDPLTIPPPSELSDHLAEVLASGEVISWMNDLQQAGVVDSVWNVNNQLVLIQLKNPLFKRYGFDVKDFMEGAKQAYIVVTEASLGPAPAASKGVVGGGDADGAAAATSADAAATADSRAAGGAAGGVLDAEAAALAAAGPAKAEAEPAGKDAGAEVDSAAGLEGTGTQKTRPEGEIASVDASVSADAGVASKAEAAAAGKADDPSAEAEATAAAPPAEGAAAAASEAAGTSVAKKDAAVDAGGTAEVEEEAAAAAMDHEEITAMLRNTMAPRVYKAVADAIAENNKGQRGLRLSLVDLQLHSARVVNATVFTERSGKLLYGVRREDREAAVRGDDGERVLAVLDVEFKARQRLLAEDGDGGEPTEIERESEDTWRFAAHLEDPQWRVVHIM